MNIIHVQEYVRINGSRKILVGSTAAVAKNAGLRTDTEAPPDASLHNTVAAVSAFNPARAANSFSPNIISKDVVGARYALYARHVGIACTLNAEHFTVTDSLSLAHKRIYSYRTGHSNIIIYS